MGSLFSKSRCELNAETNYPFKTRSLKWTIKNMKTIVESFEEVNNPENWSTDISFHMEGAPGLPYTKWGICFQRIPGSGNYAFKLKRISTADLIDNDYEGDLLVKCNLSIIGSSNANQVYKTFNHGVYDTYETLVEFEPGQLITFASYKSFLESKGSLRLKLEMMVHSKISTLAWKALGSGNSEDFFTLAKLSKTKLTEDILKIHIESKDKDHDFKLNMVNDNVTIQAHKSVLSARSSVFKTMFSHDTLENPSGEVNIEGISSEVMSEIFIPFIYLGELPFSDKPSWTTWTTYPDEVLDVATKYNLADLRAFCDQNLANLCTKDNVLEMYYFARRYSLPTASSQILTFVYDNSDKEESPAKRQRME